jgi:hypothetical protein
VILQHQIAGHAGAGAAGLATAFGHTFWWAVGFTALAVISALLLPSGRPDQAPATRPASQLPQPSRAPSPDLTPARSR